MSPPAADRVRRLVESLEGVLGKRWVFHRDEERLAYSYDASLARARPDVVCLPGSTAEVAAAVRAAVREGLPFVARGAGTGIAGGSVPVAGGLVIGLARLNRILEIDLADRYAVVEPGVVNLTLDQALGQQGYCYRPDPSSQKVCTLGGNVANNSGGPHCLAYGVTANHILGVEVVLPDGSVTELGARHVDPLGYDLTGVFVGSEGTMGIATKVVCRIARSAEGVRTMLASYARMEDAAASVSAIIAAGIVPAALEMMDGPIIRAVEEFIGAGYPVDAAAVLLIEVEGLGEGLDGAVRSIESICKARGARQVRVADSEAERQRLWAGRKGALGAVARLKPRYYLHDGVVPRTRLLSVLQAIADAAARHRLTIVNVFHAGDGNLHPLILFDPADADETHRVHVAGEEIMRACVASGGTLSGEHGIGLEKNDMMDWVYSPEDLEAMQRVRSAFDPEGLANPQKVFPARRGCAELRADGHGGRPAGEMWI
ncbi:MAG: FAD-binding protein [Candidatus Wallbacteria bacterium]|nr:FAD-binding protein [Candidatus Wallbacteria bacterium]